MPLSCVVCMQKYLGVFFPDKVERLYSCCRRKEEAGEILFPFHTGRPPIFPLSRRKEGATCCTVGPLGRRRNRKKKREHTSLAFKDAHRPRKKGEGEKTLCWLLSFHSPPPPYVRNVLLSPSLSPTHIHVFLYYYPPPGYLRRAEGARARVSSSPCVPSFPSSSFQFFSSIPFFPGKVTPCFFSPPLLRRRIWKGKKK